MFPLTTPQEILWNKIFTNFCSGYYGKRSADEAAPAESGPNAEANADPWYSYYGGYGYGAYRPYGYGYHAYRPYGYAYWG